MSEHTVTIPARLGIKLLTYLNAHCLVSRKAGSQRVLNDMGALKNELEEHLEAQCSEEELKVANVAAMFER